MEQATRQGMQTQVPLRSNRKQAHTYDKHLYKLRHLLENAILHLNHGAISLLGTPNGRLIPRCCADQMPHAMDQYRVTILSRM